MSAFHAVILSFFYGLLLLGKSYVSAVLTHFVGTKTLEVAGDLVVFLGVVGRGAMMRFSITMGDVSCWHSLHSFGIPESLYTSVVDYLFQRWFDILGWDTHTSIAVAVQNADINIRTTASLCIKFIYGAPGHLAPGVIFRTLWFFFPDALRDSHSNFHLAILHLVHLAKIQLEAHLVRFLSMVAIASVGVLVFCVSRSGAEEPEGSPCSKILDSLSNHPSTKAPPTSSPDGADTSPGTLVTPTTPPTDCAAETNLRADLDIGNPGDPNCMVARDSPDLIEPIPSSLMDIPSAMSDTCLGALFVSATTSTHSILCANDSILSDDAPDSPIMISATSDALATNLAAPTPAACSCLSDLILKYQAITSPRDHLAISYPVLGVGTADEPVSSPNAVVLVQDTFEDINLSCQEDAADDLIIPLASLNARNDAPSTGVIVPDDSELCPWHARDDSDGQKERRPSDGIKRERDVQDSNPRVHMDWSTGQHAESKTSQTHSNVPNKTVDSFSTSPDASGMEVTVEHSDTSEEESDLTCLSTQPSSTMSDVLTPPSKFWDAPSIGDDCPPSPLCYPVDSTILAELPSDTMEVSPFEEPRAVQTDEIALEQLFDAIHLRMFSRPRSSRSTSCQQPWLNPLATAFIPPKGAPTKHTAPETFSNSHTKPNVGAKRPHSSTANQPRTYRITSQPARKTHPPRRRPTTRERSTAFRSSREQDPKYTFQKRPSRRLTLNNLHKLLAIHTNQN